MHGLIPGVVRCEFLAQKADHLPQLFLSQFIEEMERKISSGHRHVGEEIDLQVRSSAGKWGVRLHSPAVIVFITGAETTAHSAVLLALVTGLLRHFAEVLCSGLQQELLLDTMDIASVELGILAHQLHDRLVHVLGRRRTQTPSLGEGNSGAVRGAGPRHLGKLRELHRCVRTGCVVSHEANALLQNCEPSRKHLVLPRLCSPPGQFCSCMLRVRSNSLTQALILFTQTSILRFQSLADHGALSLLSAQLVNLLVSSCQFNLHLHCILDPLCEIIQQPAKAVDGAIFVVAQLFRQVTLTLGIPEQVQHLPPPLLGLADEALVHGRGTLIQPCLVRALGVLRFQHRLKTCLQGLDLSAERFDSVSKIRCFNLRARIGHQRRPLTLRRTTAPSARGN
mmetsp:Transcript_85224/g.227836  ORF Transcript_85224/g.227836 Transcript_85224/m.227836 type:complete len:395 (-) Transcript_85224:149-1333(-)